MKKNKSTEMEDIELGIIYALKRGEDVIDFLSEYTGTPKEHYSEKKIYEFLTSVFKGYIENADSPRLALYDFFSSLHVTNPFLGNQEEQKIVRKYVTKGIITALQSAQVREQDKETGEWKYINGFRPLSENDLKY